MNAKHTLLILAAALLTSVPTAFAEVLLGATDLDAGAGEKIRVVVPPTDVAIDGEVRAQLGRSLADSVIAGLLQSGRYRVVDSADLGLMSAATADNKLAESLIEKADADLFLVSRLVGEFDYFHFTVREIDAKSKEVINVHQISHKGTRDEVYELVPQFLQRFGAPAGAAPTGQGGKARNPMQKPAKIKEGGATFYPLKGGNTVNVGADPAAQQAVQDRPPAPRKQAARVAPPVAKPRVTPTPQPEVKKAIHYPRARAVTRVEKIPVGTIQLVNVPWKFCVIKPHSGVELEIYDRLEILTGAEQTVFAKLYVKRFDNGRIIADYGNNKWNRVLYPGETVYAWQDVPAY